MSRQGWTASLRAGTALGLLVIATAQANAGAFAIREQSAYGQGSSFAGVAAGGALSSMFWNPAIMTQFQGIVSETGFTGLIPHASHTPKSGTALLSLGGVDNGAEMGLVPNSYSSYQLSPNFWLGLSINAPFGLSVSFPDAWAGRNYAGDSLLKTYNATPSIAYRINDWISIGAGVQLQYAKAEFLSGLPTGLGQELTLRGRGFGFGFTAGATITPTPTTLIGIGWRSSIDQDIHGTMLLPGGAAFNPPFSISTPGSVETTLKLPDIVSLGIRQAVGPQWTLLGTVEWSNWSRIGTSTINQLNGAPATVLAGLGGGAVTLPFEYDDGWFFSVGAEYRWNERLTLRGGIGYEISPITDQVRTPRVPDNDRFWASIGASWKVFKGVHFDLAYTHLWFKDPNINITATSLNPWFVGVPYVGTVDAHSDMISGALVVRFDDIEPTVKRPYMK
jgi:long-chain fatty acid transport protein